LRERPLGVTILALFFWLNAVVYGALGMLALISPALVAALLETITPGPGQGPAWLTRVGDALPLYFLLMTGATALLGHGLWTVRNWARIATVTLAGLSLIAVLAGLVKSASSLGAVGLSLAALRVGIAALVAGYLSSRGIRDAFGTPRLLRA
jgi:hypothetical protein